MDYDILTGFLIKATLNIRIQHKSLAGFGTLSLFSRSHPVLLLSEKLVWKVGL
ncbi:MAG: hypothetical protein F6K41_36410 [Symploca sp. SIO3E6]|nr:hypothetical protein [Caldora sp. SIO3E6]